MWILALSLSSAILPVGRGQESSRPLGLRAFEQSRRALQSGRVEWTTISKGKHSNFVSRYARNGDMICEYRGDDDGWTMFDADGRGIHRYPQLYLVRSNDIWWNEESSLSCRWWAGRETPSCWDRDIFDPRGLGAYSSSGNLTYTDDLKRLYGLPDEVVNEWTETIEGDIHIIRAAYEVGATITWYLNSARGWNAERITHENGDGVWEVVSDLEKWGDVWFPRETRYSFNGVATDTIVITNAQWNAEADSVRFTPADIAIEAGSNVAAQNLVAPQGPDSTIWNGEAISSLAEWNADVKAGRRKPGPQLQALIDRGHFESQYDTMEELEARKARARSRFVAEAMNQHEFLWERYTRDFAKRFRLDRD